MSRVATAALVVAFAIPAHADTPKSDASKSTSCDGCDSTADIESQEANLESREPRSGFSFAAALGGSLTMGGDIGAGRGPAVSFRLGHVATRFTNITFELSGTGALHKASMTTETLTDTNFGLFVGAQNYRSRSFWIRAAGGLTTLVKNATVGGKGDDPISGVGALAGLGLDVARFGRYLVLGFETFGILSASSDGVKAQAALSLGLTYY